MTYMQVPKIKKQKGSQFLLYSTDILIKTGLSLCCTFYFYFLLKICWISFLFSLKKKKKEVCNAFSKKLKYVVQVERKTFIINCSIMLKAYVLEHSQQALYILYVDIFYQQILKIMLQSDRQIVPIIKKFTMLLQYHPIFRMVL